MARIEVLHRRTLSIETATPEDPKGGAALNISLLDTPTSAPDAPTLAYIMTTTSLESSNTAQPAARAKKITCRRCKK